MGMRVDTVHTQMLDMATVNNVYLIDRYLYVVGTGVDRYRVRTDNTLAPREILVAALPVQGHCLRFYGGEWYVGCVDSRIIKYSLDWTFISNKQVGGGSGSIHIVDNIQFDGLGFVHINRRSLTATGSEENRWSIFLHDANYTLLSAGGAAATYIRLLGVFNSYVVICLTNMSSLHINIYKMSGTSPELVSTHTLLSGVTAHGSTAAVFSNRMLVHRPGVGSQNSAFIFDISNWQSVQFIRSQNLTLTANLAKSIQIIGDQYYTLSESGFANFTILHDDVLKLEMLSSDDSVHMIQPTRCALAADNNHAAYVYKIGADFYVRLLKKVLYADIEMLTPTNVPVGTLVQARAR
jgi:hypothetical protein